MPNLKVSLNIGFINATQEDILDIDDQEWAECETEEDREKLIDSYATEWAWNYIEIGAHIVD